MKIKTETLSGNTPTQQILRVYDVTGPGEEDQILCDVVLDEINPPVISLQFSHQWSEEDRKKGNTPRSN